MNLKTIYLLLYSGVILLLANYVYNNPAYNWDILPYMALAIESDLDSNESNHAQTYNFAKTTFEPKVYQKLIDNRNQYRSRSANNFEFFHKNLDLYRVKPLYNLAVSIFCTIGIPIDQATIVPGLIAFIGIGIILYLWLNINTPIKFSIIISVCLLFLILPTIRLSTPDALSSFFIITSVYFVKNKHDYLALLLLLLSLFTRIDNAVFTSFFGLYILSKGEYNKILLPIYQLVVITAVAIIYMYLPEEGGMLSNSPHFGSLTNYLISITKNVYGLLLLTPFGIIAVISFFSLFIFLRKTIAVDDLNTIWIIGLSIIIRMIILPVHHSRFYVAYEILLIILILKSYETHISKTGRSHVS